MVLISLFGFLSGAVFAGATVYYYILGEYRVSNEMLTEDIYVRFYLHTIPYFVFFIVYRFNSHQALQSATQKLQTYISELESRVDQLQKKK